MKWWKKDTPKAGKRYVNGREDAKKAVADAQGHLDDAKSQWPEVRRVVDSLAESRRQNHFAYTIGQIFRGT